MPKKCDFCKKTIKVNSTCIKTKKFNQIIKRADYELSASGRSTICKLNGETYISGCEFLINNADYCNIDCLVSAIKDNLDIN
jgi:hypothetical protein